MYRYITIVLALFACSSAKPAVVAPLSYSAPLYATAGTSQVDVRSNYNGGYATALGYGTPLAARVATAVSPFAYTAPVARYASPAIAAQFGYAAPVARYASPLAAAAYASPYATSYAAPYTAAYSPYAASYAAPYAAAYGAPYTLAAPAAAPVLL